MRHCLAATALLKCSFVVAMLLGFAVVPFGPDLYVLDINIGLLFFLGMTSLL